MQTRQFLDLLQTHPEKELIFEHRPDFFVPKAYHITEVKNVHIESVDCGGRPGEDFQTIVQLWIPSTGEPSERNMLAGKALKIFDLVEKMKPLRPAADILFEWGDDYLPVSNYRVHRMEVNEDAIVMQLFVQPTVCKPRLELAQAGKTAACC